MTYVVHSTYTASLPVCIRSLVTNHGCTIVQLSVHRQVDYCPPISCLGQVMGLLMNLAYAVYHVRSQDILAYLCTPDGICVSIIILHVKYAYCITPSVHQVTGNQSHMYVPLCNPVCTPDGICVCTMIASHALSTCHACFDHLTHCFCNQGVK